MKESRVHRKVIFYLLRPIFLLHFKFSFVAAIPVRHRGRLGVSTELTSFFSFFFYTNVQQYCTSASDFILSRPFVLQSTVLPCSP